MPPRGGGGPAGAPTAREPERGWGGSGLIGALSPPALDDVSTYREYDASLDRDARALMLRFSSRQAVEDVGPTTPKSSHSGHAASPAAGTSGAELPGSLHREASAGQKPWTVDWAGSAGRAAGFASGSLHRRGHSRSGSGLGAAGTVSGAAHGQPRRQLASRIRAGTSSMGQGIAGGAASLGRESSGAGSEARMLDEWLEQAASAMTQTVAEASGCALAVRQAQEGRIIDDERLDRMLASDVVAAARRVDLSKAGLPAGVRRLIDTEDESAVSAGVTGLCVEQLVPNSAGQGTASGRERLVKRLLLLQQIASDQRSHCAERRVAARRRAEPRELALAIAWLLAASAICVEACRISRLRHDVELEWVNAGGQMLSELLKANTLDEAMSQKQRAIARGDSAAEMRIHAEAKR